MAWTTPRSWIPGELVSASMMNTHVRDNENYLMSLFTGWTDITLNGGHYTTDAGSWTVVAPQLQLAQYLKQERTLKYNLVISGSAIAGSPTQLFVTLDIGIALSNGVEQDRVVYFNDGAVVHEALVKPYDGTHLVISKVDGSIIVDPVSLIVKTEAQYVS